MPEERNQRADSIIEKVSHPTFICFLTATGQFSEKLLLTIASPLIFAAQ